MISGASAVFKYWDKDGDGKLSRVELEAMVDYAIRRAAGDFSRGKITPDLEKRRQELLRSYASQDTDHDGYLTLDELLKGPLASFDCMDANHDGTLSTDELPNGMDRCADVNLGDHAPKPLASGAMSAMGRKRTVAQSAAKWTRIPAQVRNDEKHSNPSRAYVRVRALALGFPFRYSSLSGGDAESGAFPRVFTLHS